MPPKNCIVVHVNVARQLHTIRQDDVVTDGAVVRDVCIGHDQAIRADRCLAGRRRAAADCDELANLRIVANEDIGRFPAELLVLRLSADRDHRRYAHVLADMCSCEQTRGTADGCT